SARRVAVRGRVRVGEVRALEVQRQLEDALLHELAPVADEQLDVVREQVVVAPHGALEEVRQEDGAEAADDGRDLEPPAELLQAAPCPLAQREDVLVRRLALELLDRRERRRGGRRMPVERPGEEGGAARRGGGTVHPLRGA